MLNTQSWHVYMVIQIFNISQCIHMVTMNSLKIFTRLLYSHCVILLNTISTGTAYSHGHSISIYTLFTWLLQTVTTLSNGFYIKQSQCVHMVTVSASTPCSHGSYRLSHRSHFLAFFDIALLFLVAGSFPLSQQGVQIGRTVPNFSLSSCMSSLSRKFSSLPQQQHTSSIFVVTSEKKDHLT